MEWNKSPPPYETPAGFVPAETYQPPESVYPQMPQLPSEQQQPPQQQQQQQPATVIVQNLTTQMVALGHESARMHCPSCNADIMTRVNHVPRGSTHCWAICLFFILCWPCICIPYCMDSCKNANHYCPNCSAYVGTFRP